MLEKVRNYLDALDVNALSTERKAVLQPLIDYVQNKLDENLDVKLNFICTHNSRRSQFGQIWAKATAEYYNLPISTFSGGVEVTAFHPNALNTIRKAGFEVTQSEKSSNPEQHIFITEGKKPLITFSKKYDDPANPTEGFAAIMTCSHANETCPFIAGAEKRIPMTYEDPKEFDGTSQEEQKYEERSRQIATEMKYVFSKIKTA
tara:strand:- start:2757 stop:3368 length:612 start_codon:yes stop_codon:yes gene_type:complete